ncbi:MAG: hypothetical protein E7001_00555 [Coriobacteriaceae bacterium]|nr:hypothetical protein [Coriobacteriaceae bacterium]
MNCSNIKIWYDSGSVDEIHLPDPAFDDGVAAQREYLDFSDPDKGIWIERAYIAATDPESEQKGWLELEARTLLVSPEDLKSAVLVQCHGLTVLARKSGASNHTGLVSVLFSSLGLTG